MPLVPTPSRASAGPLRRRLVALAATLLTAALSVPLGVVVATPAAAWDMTSPFAREVVRPGDVDRDVNNIEHVYEVQIRLRRLGLLGAAPNGVFGPQTERAVRTFQRRNGLRVTGTVNYRTWRPLIRKSLRGRKKVPAVCKSPGWHVCYDRTWYQASLYRDGKVHNSWLVRGGAANEQTRVGSFTVYRRSENHVSNLYNAPMPYAQFFSGGQALHGSRAMMNPLEGHSHGCVNFWVEDARQLWRLTHDKHLRVHVYGAWR